MEPFFMGQILMWGGNFAPRGYAFCNGQLLSINDNQALFSILGTTYGGDGRTTFGLPDYRGRAAVSPGTGPGLTNFNLGEKIGAPTTTLVTANMPNAIIAIPASSEDANSDEPGNNSPAVTGTPLYSSDAADEQMAPGKILGAGANPINNMQPSACVSYIIALQGVYPSRS